MSGQPGIKRFDAPRFRSDRLTAQLILGVLTQKELARDMGVDEATVSRWCNGHREPTKENVRRLAQIFDCDAIWFYGLEDQAA